MTTTFAPLKIGGGGQSTGVDISPDGTTLTNAVDVFGCSIYNYTTSQWDQLITVARGFDVSYKDEFAGGNEIICAPSQPTTIFIWLCDGKLYRSLDRGASFTHLTNFAATGVNQGNNFGLKFNGHKLAVDPLNPDVLYIGTIANGVYRCTNATQGTGSTPTFTLVTGIPATSTYPYAMAFEKGGGSSNPLGYGTSTNVLYVMSAGSGVYSMSAPSGAFSAVASCPTTFAYHMVVSPYRTLWVADGTSIHKYVPTGPTWTTYTSGTTGISPVSVTIDTSRSSSASAESVIIASGASRLARTPDSGATWPGGSHEFTRSSPEIPWMELTEESYLTHGNMVYDAQRDLIVLASGIGMWTAPGSTAADFVWTSQSKGIESMQPNGIVAGPNTTSTPSMYMWDRGTMHTSDPTAFVAVQDTSLITSIMHGWGIDWAKSSPSTFVSYIVLPTVGANNPGNPGSARSFPVDASSISTDSGVNYSLLPMSATSYSANLTTNATAAAGTRDLSFGSTIPTWVGRGIAIKNASNGSITSALVVAQTLTTITIDRDILAPGVGIGNTITVGFVGGSGQVRGLQTNATSAGGTSVVHFASAPHIYPGMIVNNLSNSTSVDSGSRVLSVSGGDVTLNYPLLSGVASGDIFEITDAVHGGGIAVASPTNFMIMPSNAASFPKYTVDGGATWDEVNISGVPRVIYGSITASSDTVTVNSTADITIGATFTSQSVGGVYGFQQKTVTSIINSTQFTASTTSNVTINPTLIEFSGWGSAYYQNLRNVVADSVTADKFYMYNSDTGMVYVTTDKGVTWTIANRNEATFTGTIVGDQLTVSGVTGTIGPYMRVIGVGTTVVGSPRIISGGGSTWTLNGSVPSVGPIAMSVKYDLAVYWGMTGGLHMSIKAVPNNAGHLFMIMANTYSDPTRTMGRSTDGGATWTEVPGPMSTVSAIGFGKPMPGGGGYPTVFFYGKKFPETASKLWRSDDNCVTWVELGQFLTGVPNYIIDLDGDKNVYGKIYGAVNLNGWFVGAEEEEVVDIETPAFGFSVIHGHAKRKHKMIGY